MRKYIKICLLTHTLTCFPPFLDVSKQFSDKVDLLLKL